MDCCEVCGKVAMTSTRLFTATKGNNIKLCKLHDTDLFLLGEIRFFKLYPKAKGKRKFDERKTYTNSIGVKAALV